ncbi:MAG TPA: sigma-70 family RNA polymerase sigma factor, partial [Planctomycetota bacterium]|nr:sigma-70 family RNA polymerase sigma factor [Planctomycetota bacterium]
ARKGAPLVDVEPDLEPSNIPQPIDAAIATEIEDRVCRALASLPPIQRAVVSLRLEGLDTREIAALLDSTTDRVKSNLYHARARLRVLLADLLGPDPRDELDPDPTPNHGSSP